MHCQTVSQLGEASRTILHGICARAPQAADVSAPPSRLARRPARLSRSASGHAVAAGSGVGRLSESAVRFSQVPDWRRRAWQAQYRAARRQRRQRRQPWGLSRRRERRGGDCERSRAAWRSATRPSSGLQMGLRWPGRLQRRPAHVRRPCRCSALVCARICSCSRRADRRCCVCMCVRGTRPEARRKGPTLPHTAEQAAAQRYLLRVPITCMNLIFSSLNYTHSRDCSRLQRGNT